MPDFGAVRAVKHFFSHGRAIAQTPFCDTLNFPGAAWHGRSGPSLRRTILGRSFAFYRGAFMSDYDKEKWVKLYRTAMLELEHAKMAGRIRDTRIEIAARIKKLHDIPGLHAQEKQAIEDALSGLRVLEREEARYEADERRIAEPRLENL